MGGYARDGITAYQTSSEIHRPSEKMVFVDAASRLQWIADSFWPVDMGTSAIRWRILNEHNITARHNDGCNMSFADFHCEHWKWKDPRTIKLAYWEIRPDEASDNNIDLERVIKVLK
jgi:prepilin-type processing-associated H-X9-DG protein